METKMKKQYKFLITVLILFMFAFNIPLLAEENSNNKLESTSYYEEFGNSKHYVNHRFDSACGFVLDEEFDVTYYRGIDGTKSNLTVKAYKLSSSNNWALSYTINANAESGGIYRLLPADYPYYLASKGGTGGAESTQSIFHLTNGNLFFTYTGELATCTIHNIGFARIASYHSAEACIDNPIVVKKKASGILTFSTPEYNMISILFYLDGSTSDWTPDIKFINNFTKKSSSKLEFIGKYESRGEEENRFYKLGMSLQLQFESGEPVIIPISNGELDIKNIKCPEQFTYEIVNNDIVLKARQFNDTGYSLYKQGKDKDAIEQYKKAIALIEDPSFYYNYGNSLSNLNQYEEAIKAYDNSRKLGYNPMYLCLYNTACAYSRLGKTNEAYKYLQLSIREGYTNIKHIKEDPDLGNLRKDKDWDKWLEKATTED